MHVCVCVCVWMRASVRACVRVVVGVYSAWLYHFHNNLIRLLGKEVIDKIISTSDTVLGVIHNLHIQVFSDNITNCTLASYQ